MSQTTDPSADTASPALSVVIPAYNEVANIARAIDQIRHGADQVNGPIEIIIVDDGSTDGTAEAVRRCIEAADHPRIRIELLSNEHNLGKARTVHRGVEEAAGRLILFTDADMSTPFSELVKLLDPINRGYEVVIGSRDMPESVLDSPQPWLRRRSGGLFRTIRRLLLLPELRDTQCGFKLFTGAAAATVFAEQIDTTPAFDCELLALAVQHGYRIKEVGVLWQDHPDSRIDPIHDGLAMLISVFKIARRHRRAMKARGRDTAAP